MSRRVDGTRVNFFDILAMITRLLNNRVGKFESTVNHLLYIAHLTTHDLLFNLTTKIVFQSKRDTQITFIRNSIAYLVDSMKREISRRVSRVISKLFFSFFS